MANNVSPLVAEIRQLKELATMVETAYNNSRNARNVNRLLKKEIVDRVATLCYDFLRNYEETPWYDSIRTDGYYADLYGMLTAVLEELRK